MPEGSKTKSLHAMAAPDSTVLIKPGIDASDKEMHYRNQFAHISTNMTNFMEAAFRDSDVLKTVFKPKRLGQLTKDNVGVHLNTLDTENQKDFRRIDYTDKGRRIQI